jgi:hypothetical protein
MPTRLLRCLNMSSLVAGTSAGGELIDHVTLIHRLPAPYQDPCRRWRIWWSSGKLQDQDFRPLATEDLSQVYQSTTRELVRGNQRCPRPIAIVVCKPCNAHPRRPTRSHVQDKGVAAMTDLVNLPFPQKHFAVTTQNVYTSIAT